VLNVGVPADGVAGQKITAVASSGDEVSETESPHVVHENKKPSFLFIRVKIVMYTYYKLF